MNFLSSKFFVSIHNDSFRINSWKWDFWVKINKFFISLFFCNIVKRNFVFSL